MIYLVCFSFSITITWLLEHSNQAKGRTPTKIVISCIILLIPSLLSGFRDISVGTDTLSYYNRFLFAKGNSLWQYAFGEVSYIGNENLEPGFLVLMWVISRFTHSFGVFEFILTFLTLLIFYKGADYFFQNKGYSLTLMLSIYFFVYYCAFLNYQRQGLAASILWYGLTLADRKKLKSFIILILLASSIHISSIIFIVVYLLWQRSNKMKNSHILLLIVGSIIVLYLGPQLMYRILSVFSGLGIRSQTIYKYSMQFGRASEYGFHGSQLLMVIPQLILFSFTFKKLTNEYESAKGLFCVCILHAVLTAVGSINANFNRITIMVSMCEILMFAQLYKSAKRNNIVIVARIGISVYLLLYWIFFTVYNNYYFDSPVYPYRTSLF